jgi:hypothetical protein
VPTQPTARPWTAMRLVARVLYPLCPAERSTARRARQKILRISRGLCRISRAEPLADFLASAEAFGEARRSTRRVGRRPSEPLACCQRSLALSARRVEVRGRAAGARAQGPACEIPATRNLLDDPVSCVPAGNTLRLPLPIRNQPSHRPGSAVAPTRISHRTDPDQPIALPAKIAETRFPWRISVEGGEVSRL